MKDNRYRLRFSRYGAVVFLSHLDMQRAFQKAIRRANLPISFSKGFNPHQLMSFALPLSTGMAADNEYIELEFEQAQNEEELVNSLNSVLPEGIEIIEAMKMSATEKTYASLICGAEYEACQDYDDMLYNGLDRAIADILSETEIIVDKQSKSGVKRIDIRDKIISVENISSAKGIYLRMKLAAGSEKSVKPELVYEFLCKAAGAEYRFYTVRYIRTKLLLNL